MKDICEFIDVEKRYSSRIVLDGFNLSVQEGEMVAIVGKSGSGKTTVLNIMGLLEKADQGTVRIFGHKSPRIGSRRVGHLLRTRIAYLFQNCALIDNATIGENLEIPFVHSKTKRKEKLRLKKDALEKVGLKDVSLKQRVYGLSGGEQQRVAIARLLLKPCDLILADEPTGSLDESNRGEIVSILRGLNRGGKTIVVVTHDPFVADACDRKVYLEHE